MKAMNGGLNVSQGEGRWTTIFTMPLQPISPMPTD